MFFRAIPDLHDVICQNTDRGSKPPCDVADWNAEMLSNEKHEDGIGDFGHTILGCAWKLVTSYSKLVNSLLKDT